MSTPLQIDWQCVFQDDQPGLLVAQQSQTWAAEFGEGWLVRHYNMSGTESMVYVPRTVGKHDEKMVEALKETVAYINEYLGAPQMRRKHPKAKTWEGLRDMALHALRLS